ncbi:MAG: polysaccharide biosynthesis C-terminal domain-containing protein [Bacteroidales bacterium]|nr:polysaccharide biosynthesis C-terminal domain-containing protein [Bacteroidales bacterium]
MTTRTNKGGQDASQIAKKNVPLPLIMGVIARQTIKGSIANYLGIAIGFVTTFFVLTDCLSADEIGLTRILVDAAMLFSSLAMLGANNSIIRFYPYFKEEDGSDHGFFAWALLLPLVGFLLFAIAFVLCKNGIVTLYAEHSQLFTKYVYHLLPLTFFALYTTVFESCSNVLMRIAVPKFVREVLIRLCNLVAYLLYGHSIISLDLFVFLFCTSYAIAATVDFCYLLSMGKISFRIDRHFITTQMVRRILGYTLITTVVSLSSNVQLFNSLFIGAQGGLAMAGVYTIASYIANVIGVPSRSLLAISGPVVAQSMKEGDIGTVNQLAQKVSLHQLLVSSMLYFFICINLNALYSVIPNGANYVAGTAVVLIMGFSNIISQTCSIVIPVLNYSNRYILSLPFTLLLTITALTLNALLIPLMGVSGAATATLGAALIYNISQLVYVHCKLKISIFSKRQISIVAIMVLLALLERLWTWLLTPLMPHVLIDAIAKSGILAVIAILLTLRANISDDVNNLFFNIYNKLRRKGNK